MHGESYLLLFKLQHIRKIKKMKKYLKKFFESIDNEGNVCYYEITETLFLKMCIM